MRINVKFIYAILLSHILLFYKPNYPVSQL